MASIDLIRASDGSGNASVATVQTTRSPGATTIDVDTVQGINDTFCATMGTPHTFTDPVTSETITVISEATAVDFIGHVDGSNLEIDTIAPGYTDGGSAVGDIIIIKPTTQWGDNVADVLAVSHNDDGTLKAVTENPGWTALAYTPNTVTCNGNRSYTLTFNSVNLTTAISPGMRLRTTRTVSAPTGAISLNGSSQYANKTSPSGMTFTDDFVVSAWVKLTQYGATSTIASRWNGTSGWQFYISSTGNVFLVGNNAGSGNNSYVQSYQSVPLNKWVHVAAQLDMSSFTATTTTSYVMIDGVDVPATVGRNGTNPTALVQAGNLEVGSGNGGLLPFPGNIAQVAIYSAKVTQANVRATISQTLSGSETSLISAYKLDQSSGLTDLNTGNANNLTAQGSPSYSTASPFTTASTGTPSGTTDHAIVTKTAYSTNTDITVQVPEGCTIPTTGGVSAVSYSTQKAPYLFPADAGKWRVELLILSAVTASGSAASTVYNPGGLNLNVPLGAWKLSFNIGGQHQPSGTGLHHYIGVSTSSSSFSDLDLEVLLYQTGLGAGSISVAKYAAEKTITTSAATPYYVLVFSGVALGAAAIIKGLVTPANQYESSKVTAELAYL